MHDFITEPSQPYYLPFIFYPQAGDLTKISVNSKVKFELSRNGTYWGLLSITPTDFMECKKCRISFSNTYETLDCRGCTKERHELVKGMGTIIDYEVKDYVYSTGLKLTINLHNDVYYAVIFPHGIYYNYFLGCSKDDQISFEAWITKGKLIRIFNLF